MPTLTRYNEGGGGWDSNLFGYSGVGLAGIGGSGSLGDEGGWWDDNGNYHPPTNEPPPVMFGDISPTYPGGISIGGDNTGEIGSGYVDVTTPANPIDFGTGHGSLGPENTTPTQGGGVFGSGIDFGIPGLVTAGGLLAGGAALGGSSIFGGNASTPSPAPTPQQGGGIPVVPPLILQPSPGVGDNGPAAQPPITVPPLVIQPPTNTSPPGVGDNGPIAPQPIVVPPINIVPPATTTPPVTTTPPATVTPPTTTAPPTVNPPVTQTPPVTTVPPVIPTTPTPTTPVTPAPTNPPTVTPPVTPTPMPTTTNPLDRNILTEGGLTNAANLANGQGIYNNYNALAGLYGHADLNNYGDLFGQLFGTQGPQAGGYRGQFGSYGAQPNPYSGGYNATLTGAANAQTQAGNTALRAGNVNDAAQLGGDALTTLQTLNPNLYNALNQAQMGANRYSSQGTNYPAGFQDQGFGQLSPEEAAAIAAQQGGTGGYERQLGQTFFGGPQFGQVNPNTSFTSVNPNTSFNQVQTQQGDAGLNYAQSQLGRAPSQIQQTLQQQAQAGLNLGSSLSDEDTRNAQQAAREAWSARGLVNSRGAVGDEILNRYNLGQQRLQQRQAFAQGVDTNAFNQGQQGFSNALGYSGASQGYAGLGLQGQQANLGAQLQGNNLGFQGQTANLGAQLQGNQLAYQGALANQNAGLQAQSLNNNLGLNLLNTGYGQQNQQYQQILQNAQLQSQNRFDPFASITNANTTNQGSNAQLFGQGAGFSSGAYGNQNVNQLVNPYSPYANDVYSTNINRATDLQIAAGNNAAGMQAGTNQFLGRLAQALGSYYGCWVARECFGQDNPKWLLFRHWLFNRAPKWFVRFYLEHGIKIAAWLRLRPWAKPPVRYWMESRVATLSSEDRQSALKTLYKEMRSSGVISLSGGRKHAL